MIGLFLQVGVGFSAMIAGLLMGMQAVGAMVISRYSVHLFNKYGASLPIAVGLIGIAIFTPMIMLINNSNMLIFCLILFFIRGIFSGLCGTPIQTISVINFNKKEISTINVVFNTCRQVSISFGVVISSLLISLGMHIAKVPSTSYIPKDKVIKIFAYGFCAIPIIAIIGVWIVSGITKTRSLK